MVKWKFGLNLEILETWTEFLVHFSFLKWIWNSIVQCFVVTKVSGWVFVGLWWLPYPYILHILHSWKEMLERRTASASPWFRSPAPCDLWKASQQRQKRIETHQTSKSWQVSKKVRSADLPVTSVTVGRHLERRRALCRCGSRSRWSRGRRKAPFPQGEAGRRMAPRWCRCLPGKAPNQTSAYQLSFQMIKSCWLSIATILVISMHFYLWPML